MSDATARFALPFILPGQAQKELFHNEALTAIDCALHAAVEAPAPADPPEAPPPGACWIVPVGATGAWQERAGHLAAWTAGGWRFQPPIEGMTIWDRSAGLPLRFAGGAWTSGEISCSAVTIGGQQVVGARLPPVPSPSGGTIIDAEARAALEAVIATLMSHGLIG